MPVETMTTPAQTLAGKQLKDWKVIELISVDEDATGGYFSSQYRVENIKTGQKAFLKAIDIHKRLVDKPAHEQAALQERGLRHFRYESKLLSVCADRRMDRIVRALDSDIHIIDVPEYGATLQIPYLVFELADSDLRHHPKNNVFNLAWRLRIFHGVTTALSQLHRAEIAHQDIKPSNVLIFSNDFAKLGDLGRATDRNSPSDYETSEHIGDRNYSPPELLYGEYLEGSWDRRRFGADLFMLGCVLTFLMTDSSYLVLLFSKLDKQFWPINWGGSYRSVVPHLQAAAEAVFKEIEATLPPVIGLEICGHIYRLCDPDFIARGWPHQRDEHNLWSADGRGGSVLQQFDLQQVISRFDFLAVQAQVGNLSVNPLANRTRFWRWFLDNNR
jgi:eukaryotic-like serine/threonine-protein kinase